MASDEPDRGTDEGVVERLQTSRRDEGELQERLRAWLAYRPDVGTDVRVERCQRPEANGMSSDTLLFDASWDAGGRRHVGSYVARVRPADDAFPIFPSYDLERQVRAMGLVGERTRAPVPTVRWYEPDEEALGAPFFVMDRVDGRVPPDVMPYPCDGSWVQEATGAERDHLQARSLDILAAIHGVEADPEEAAFLLPPGPGTPLRRHFEQERAYYEWAREGLRFPVLERALDWLEERWPEAADAAPAVVCWGDARIGNVIYDGFEPRAVLDWEMATLGPRELDLGWFIFLHRFFDDIARDLGMAGLPDFVRRDRVVAQYRDRTGHEPRDLDWFLVYAATRHGAFMSRAMRRRVMFGEVESPADPEDLILHRWTLEQMIG